MLLYVRLLILVLFASLSGLSIAAAQVAKKPTPDIEVPQDPASKSPPQQPKNQSFELARDLDGLFDQLRRTRDRNNADRISTRIWEIWQTSDSRSIDLLTLWARSASGRRRFDVALDLMDQVVAMRPDYAEGFNQRATLHFMMENYGKSIADIERTLALEPRHYGALAGLAAILERLEKKDDALETWYRTLTIYPAMKSAQDAVIRLEEELAGSGI